MFQTAQIIFLGKTRNQKVLKIFSYPDDEMFEKLRPKTRVKWRVFGSVSADNYFIDLTSKLIRQYLENNADELNLLPSETILERLLQRINNQIFLPRPEISKKSGGINGDGVFVVVKDNSLSLTACGEVFSILVRPKLNRPDDRTNFSVTDLLKEADVRNFDPKCGFQNIVTGETLLGDVLIIGAQQLREYISNANLLNYFFHLPPKSAVEFVKNKIEDDGDLKNRLHGALLILSWRGGGASLRDVKTGGRSGASLSQFINLTKETEKILTSSLGSVSIRDTFRSILKKDARTPNNPSESSLYTSPSQKSPPYVRGGKGGLKWQKKYRFVFRIIAKFFLAALLMAKEILVFSCLTIKNLLFLVTDYKNQRKEILKNMDFGLERVILKIISKFNLLPQKSKVFLISSAALAILFSQSVFIVNAHLNQKMREEEINQKIALIRNNLSGIEASLIYKDTKTAHALLQESLNLFETLPQKTKQDRIRRTELAKEIDKTRFAYQRISIILDPAVVAIFEDQKGTQMLKADDKLIVAAENNIFFFIEPRERKMNFITTIVDANDTLKLLGIYKSSEVLFLKNDSLFTINAQNKIVKSVFWTPPETNLKQSLIFPDSNNLYALNVVENKFLKIPGGSAGFGKATAYLKEDKNIANIIGAAADGAVYLLDKKEGIIKFVQGRKKEVDWTFLDPALSIFDTDRVKMRTSEDSLFLYILDPVGRRLIVYNKNGDLKKQYTSPQFDDLRDFAIDENNKQIFLLNGNKVYGIVAEHLSN